MANLPELKIKFETPELQRQQEREEFRQWAEDIQKRQEKIIEELRQDREILWDLKEAYLNTMHGELYGDKPSLFKRLWNEIRGVK